MLGLLPGSLTSSLSIPLHFLQIQWRSSGGILWTSDSSSNPHETETTGQQTDFLSDSKLFKFLNHI